MEKTGKPAKSHSKELNVQTSRAILNQFIKFGLCAQMTIIFPLIIMFLSILIVLNWIIAPFIFPQHSSLAPVPTIKRGRLEEYLAIFP